VDDTIGVEKMMSIIITGNFWKSNFLGCAVFPHPLHAVTLLQDHTHNTIPFFNSHPLPLTEDHEMMQSILISVVTNARGIKFCAHLLLHKFCYTTVNMEHIMVEVQSILAPFFTSPPKFNEMSLT